MSDYKSDFLNLAIKEKALSFGEFVLKSGRISPYFFNAGVFYRAQALQTLTNCYAQTVIANNLNVDIFFGPAYKGIPLASATSLAYHNLTGKNVSYTFDRKETKDHGEGGNLVGADLNGKNIVLIDDVITAGTAITHATKLIRQAGGNISGIVLALDRQEKRNGDKSAVQELEQELNTKIISIINLTDLMQFIKNSPEHSAIELAMQAYRIEYGVEVQ